MSKLVSLPKRLTSATWKRRQRIARELQRFREEIDVQRGVAAQRAGVSVYVWERWEQGESAIPLERMADIAKGLAVEVAALLVELGLVVEAVAA